ncbi:very short patch repair endonuclease [Echinicola arenosa]|nr:very short patch repair endonuclease [Echinicola arenosa]
MSKTYPEQKIKVPRFSEENGFYTTKQRSYNMSRIRGKYTVNLSFQLG